MGRIYANAWKGDCEVFNPQFMLGKCALTVKWDELLKGINFFVPALKVGSVFVSAPWHRPCRRHCQLSNPINF